MNSPAISVVIPAKNEANSIAGVIARIRTVVQDAEIIIVDDGSTDGTAVLATRAGARVICHPRSLGNGAAVKSGARAARGEILVFLDADGQHDPADIPRLLALIAQGFDMAVGARDRASQASWARLFGNGIYNRLASLIVGHSITDLTSGFRAVRAEKFIKFLYLLPNGFSYPTTSTMAFFRAGYPVAFAPIHAARRTGKSHIRLLRDGGRFLLIVFRIGTLYSPLKIFFPCSLLFFLCGLIYVGYTLLAQHRFTNFGALLFVTSLLIFFMGLISEQITQLLYSRQEDLGASRSTRV